MDSTKIKVAIGLPTEGHTPAEALNSLWMHAYHLGKYEADNPEFEFFFAPSGRMLTAMTREVIMSKALAASCNYLFMVDDDMVFRADLFERLYRHHVDIVAPLAFTRNPPHLPVLYYSREGWDPIQKREYFNFDWIKNYPRNKLVECDAVGFGAVLINLDAQRGRMKQGPFFMCSSGTGEDIFYCLQAKKAGMRVFCDTSTVIGHLSNPSIIDEKTSEQFNDPEMIEKMYGPYKKYGCYDVCLQEPIKDADKKEVVLAL